MSGGSHGFVYQFDLDELPERIADVEKVETDLRWWDLADTAVADTSALLAALRDGDLETARRLHTPMLRLVWKGIEWALSGDGFDRLVDYGDRYESGERSDPFKS